MLGSNEGEPAGAEGPLSGSESLRLPFFTCKFPYCHKFSTASFRIRPKLIPVSRMRLHFKGTCCSRNTLLMSRKKRFAIVQPGNALMNGFHLHGFKWLRAGVRHSTSARSAPTIFSITLSARGELRCRWCQSSGTMTSDEPPWSLMRQMMLCVVADTIVARFLCPKHSSGASYQKWTTKSTRCLLPFPSQNLHDGVHNCGLKCVSPEFTGAVKLAS